MIFLFGRTDLAIELNQNSAIENQGIKQKERENNGVKFTEIEIINEQGEKALCKPKGKYITLEFENLNLCPDFKPIENELLASLKEIVPNGFEKALVVGLGNREITSDAVGPITAEKLLATRHLMGDFAKSIGLEALKSVAVIAPNVLGKTGIETAEIILAATEKVKPDLVIAVDALCSKSIHRLFRTVQICDTGISPGSGVKNSRKELSQNTLGVKVIAIGVPTVVDAETVAKELTENQPKHQSDLIVTPKDADFLSQKISEILAAALNRFLQPDLSADILAQLV